MGSASRSVVVINPPPPLRSPTPLMVAAPEGAILVRIYDPTRWNTTALTFRSNGPRLRFDHHRGRGPDRSPANDPDRAVYYASWDADPTVALASCLVEIFGDGGIVTPGELRVAASTTIRPLTLLDLRGSGAMRAGTVSAISKCEHVLSQQWSHYFYESTAMFGWLDGLFYANAHKDGPAVMLYERARDALRCDERDTMSLNAPALRPTINRIMVDHNLTF